MSSPARSLRAALVLLTALLTVLVGVGVAAPAQAQAVTKQRVYGSLIFPNHDAPHVKMMWFDSGWGYLGQKLQIDQDAMLIRMASDGLRDTGGNVRDVPVVTRNSNHTLTSSDRGRKQLKTGSGAVTYTIASGLPDGMTVVVRNRNASGNITIARDTGVELYMAGNGTNANRTVAPWGEALLHHEGGNVWSISGTGVS